MSGASSREGEGFMNVDAAKRARVFQRTPPILRAAVFIIIGLTVTFSASLHEQLAFNSFIFAMSVLTLGLVQVIVFLNPKLRPYLGVRGLATIFIDVLAALFAFIAVTSVASLAHTIAIWALASAVIAFLGRQRAHRPADAYIHTALGVLLAVAAELSLGDQVMLIGFFGAYAMIVGVFAAIAAVDQPVPAQTEPEQHDAAEESADTQQQTGGDR
jgi:uncharacterized membrane protein HdeD (DUF308 family)